jgi:hypothetical protein
MSDATYQPGFNQPWPQEAYEQTPVLNELVCDYCGEIIERGDRAFSVLPGVPGISKKSGRMTLVDEDPNNPEEAHIVHLHCIIPAALGEEAYTCMGCGEELLCPTCDDVHCANCDISTKP